jgi:Fe-S-cluster containining protein
MPIKTESSSSHPGWSDGLPPCTECGVCCFFEDPRYVMLFEGDLERLGERAEELTHWIRGRCFMRTSEGHCIALRKDGSRWLCSIYDQRPTLCREFSRGCDVCHAAVASRHPDASQERRRLPLATTPRAK